jgi:hypothetical protein
MKARLSFLMVLTLLLQGEAPDVITSKPIHGRPSPPGRSAAPRRAFSFAP